VAALIQAEDTDFSGFAFDGREELRVQDEGGSLACHARDLFNRFDVEAKGHLTSNQLRGIWAEHGLTLSEQEVCARIIA
jgi:Ca2+-binding EF-hand superfamily protein